MGKRNTEKREEVVAVAIDKDKGSQNALKWAVDNLLSPGQTVNLIHVQVKQAFAPFSNNGSNLNKYGDESEFFLPFHCFCSRHDINSQEVIVESVDIAKGIVEYVQENLVETLILGVPRNSLLRRFKTTDVPSSVTKAVPSFCTVYVISRGKVSSVRSATCLPPLRSRIDQLLQGQPSNLSGITDSIPHNGLRQQTMQRTDDEMEIKSPFNRIGYAGTYEPSMADSDISFVSSGRPSMDRVFPAFYDNLEPGIVPRLSTGSEFEDNRNSFTGSYQSGKQSLELGFSQPRLSSVSQDSGRFSWSTQSTDELEAEMRRLKMELKQTIELYSTACKEAIVSKKMANELTQLKEEKEKKLEEAKLAKENAVALVETEKAKYRAAIEAAAAAQRLAELESQKRKRAERKALKEAEEKKSALSALAQSDTRYRRYTIEEIEQATEKFSESRRIGEGGYGPVYRGTLDHTPVAIKVLRPDAVQGRSQFQQEVEVLTCMRHPNMVLLVGACPEFGCLVYEYMANGSLEDCLFQRSNVPVLPWQLRFRIAAEIATGLHFLHRTKPEPLVHRDLKPGNILLDRNFVSKISDVGLARLVPPSVANSVTQYRMTATAGTFCYIDPEYQQTGMLGTKSDIYSLGVMLLQMLTAKPPMGLSHYVQRAIEKGTFVEILDPAVLDWPVEEALIFAKLALKCAELRRKDRPDLGTIILPELNRLRAMAEDSMPFITFGGSSRPSPNTSKNNSQTQSQASTASIQEIVSDPQLQYGYESSRSNTSSPSCGGSS